MTAPETRMATDFSGIVREHGAMVFRTAWRVLGHESDAEDVVQEVFLEAFQMRRRRIVRHWPGLLRRMAVCRAVDRLRTRKTGRSLDDVPAVAHNESPEAAVMAAELSARLRTAIGDLPAREAEVFCLRFFDDLGYEEIAATLGIRRGAVATALHKARAKLERALADPKENES